MRAPLGLEGQYFYRVVTNYIRVDLQYQYESLFDPVGGVCLLGLTISWDTTITLILHSGYLWYLALNMKESYWDYIEWTIPTQLGMNHYI